ncbi:MAG: DUF2283 domain-containing protein, partial [Planctomycetes bacterium]|nr:DUF2283 domain-containing protein [Planctomycetota bacterium]
SLRGWSGGVERPVVEGERPEEGREVSEGVVLDYDEAGNLVGIDIDHASQKLDLSEVVTSHIPLQTSN